MKVNLDVPIYKQGKDKPYCGYVAMRMVMAHYGTLFKSNLAIIRAINKQLRHILPKHKRPGYYAMGLALFALQQGYDVEVITYNRQLYTKDIIHVTNKIKQLAYVNKIPLDFKWREDEVNLIRNFIKPGGRLQIKIVTKEDLLQYLANKNPVILAVQTDAIWDNRRADKHFVVLRGFDGKNFIINDSNSYHDDVAKVTPDDLMYAIHNNFGYVLAIKPKKK
jgi:hypothetical protein